MLSIRFDCPFLACFLASVYKLRQHNTQPLQLFPTWCREVHTV